MTFLIQRIASASRSQLRPSGLVQRHVLSTPIARFPSLMVPSMRSFASAQEKLQSVMEDYRKKNYGQELPSRFAKEVCKAADLDGDGFISVSEVEKLLENIGAKDTLSTDEIDEVMEEMGSKEGPKGVPIQTVVDYVKKQSKPGVS